MLTSHTKTSPFSIQLWATFLVALSGVLYGFIGYFGTEILAADFSVSNMLFWRFLIALLWMTAVTFWKKETLFQKTQDKNILLRTLIIGSICYSSATAFYFTASQETGTGLAMVIFFSYPVFVAVIGWLTKKSKINLFAASSLLAIIFGLFLLKGHGESALNMAGIVFAVGAAFFYALYVIESKKGTSVLSSHVLTFIVCLGNMLFFLVLALGSNTFAFPASFSTWVYVIALGIFATALPIQLLLDGLKFVSPLKASILSVLEPVVTLIVGVALLGETMTSSQLLGIFIVLAGATLIQFER